METVRTVKQQIRMKDHSFENDKQAWEIFNDLMYTTRDMANTAISTLFYLDTRLQIDAGIQGKWKDFTKAERNAKLKEAQEKIKEECGGVSQITQLYRNVTDQFPGYPSQIVSCVTNAVAKDYKNDKVAVMRGERAIRSYKKGYPLFVKPVSMNWDYTDEGRECFTYKFPYMGKNGNWIRFEVVLGTPNRRNPDIQKTITRVINGELKTSDPCRIARDKKNRAKMYVIFSVKDDVKEVKLDPKTYVGVDLGVAVPAYCATNNGQARVAIGDASTFLKIRTQMQRRKRSLQRELRHAKGGHGRLRKLKALNSLKTKESDFAKTKNHEYSAAIVKFALQQRASVIKLEFLEGFGRDDNGNSDPKMSFILRNWSFFDLQTKIEYKAARYGIDVVYVDPYHTSQICSKCGNYEEGQRKSQAEFVCSGCGHEVNADYNAAVNIAKSTQVVTKKEDCIYHKIKKKDKETKDAA